MEDKCIKTLICNICIICWSLYRIEWWYVIMRKASKILTDKITCDAFPTSECELKQFLQKYPELLQSRKPLISAHKTKDGDFPGKDLISVYVYCLVVTLADIKPLYYQYL